ncbi:MAG: GTP-binding protein [Candidatus Auribacter fodinae]|jgi:bifunctional enzyme CysN/CysC|uniref:GTP-binding protein n=1 Tax=Candidatus Auribacter fodinae TaxID=2093366 RepID=A0A3A4R523_9BACT|nr:MAG: GTP-binding protein [Candidatus Auribacter fodinae]
MANETSREQMNIVVVGHVDHGKSTVIGRLLTDTGSLPEGKLEQVKATCERNSKPFEYAFMLDALKDEQAQGITIDSARCFFKSKKRNYIIIDAPGHIEFLKNMISGAARAEAAVLVIDAKEGIQENSRRHGYMVSMLGIKQVVIAVNKMDLINYDQVRFESIVKDFTAFLKNVNIVPRAFVPISAREGALLIEKSPNMPWYTKLSLLDTIDSFELEKPPEDKPFRFPVQDIYKFTAMGDDRRIVAGRVESGTISVGSDVVFLPSGKKSSIKAVEGFNIPEKSKAVSGESTGFTLNTQIYIRPAEVMCSAGEQLPLVTSLFRANVFWMGHQPMIKNKKYKLKLATAQTPVWLVEIKNVLDASELSSVANKDVIERHDVAECIFQTFKPIAVDLASDFPATGRFVIVDNYEIAGGGIVLDTMGVENKLLEDHIAAREKNWERSAITTGMRWGRFGQRSTLVLIAGEMNTGKIKVAKALEQELFNNGRLTYYLGVSNTLLGIDSDMKVQGERAEYIRRLGEIAHLFTDAGLILIATVSDLDDYELDVLSKLNKPNDVLIVNIGEKRLSPNKVDLELPVNPDAVQAVAEITALLQKRNVLVEYYL